MSKNIFLGILIFVIVIAIAGFVFRKISFRSPIVFLGEPLQVVTEDEITRTTDSFVANEIVPEAQDGSIPEALLSGTKRLIIGEACSINPKNILAQVQEKILVENTTPMTKYVAFNTRTYIVPQNGFAVASLLTEGEYGIICDERTTDAVVYIR